LGKLKLGEEVGDGRKFEMGKVEMARCHAAEHLISTF
jgi:hypothetical protein